MDTVRSTRSTGTAHHTPEADADRNRLRTAIESAMASAASAVFDAVAASSSSPAAAVQSSSPSSSSTTMTASAGQSSRRRSPAAQACEQLSCFIETDDLSDFESDPFLLAPPKKNSTGRRYSAYSIKGGRKIRSRNKTAVRTIVCLPLQLVDDSTTLDKAKICFPRGNCREKLFKNGLIAKFNIDTTWNEEQITSEICDLFKNCFPVENKFGFCYLTTYPGVKMLVQPKVNTSFIWDAKAVLSIHRSTIHILSNLNHDCFSNDISSGEAHEDFSRDTVCTSMQPQKATTSYGANEKISESYRNYVEILTYSDEEDTDERVQLAIQHFLDDEHTKSKVEKSLKESLLAIKQKVNDENVNYFNINRKNVIDGAVRALKRSSFMENGRLSVKFNDNFGHSEGAIDAGGPTREFLRLVMAQISNSSIFAGHDTCKYLTKCKTSRVITKKECKHQLEGPIHTVFGGTERDLIRVMSKFVASQLDLYFYYGRLIALSIIHGGPGPNCFSPMLFNQVVSIPRTYLLKIICPTDVVYSRLLNIANSASEEEFAQVCDKNEAFLQAAGIDELRHEKKNEIIQDCVKFYTEDRVKSEIESFTCGMNVLGLVPEMKENPTVYEPLFVYHEEVLTAPKLLDTVFANINLSESGSNSRNYEDTALCYWRDYVFDVQDGNAASKIDDILIFATGALRVPPLGFLPQPSVVFSKETRFPTANTCANIITLPLGHESYETFKESMDFAILNSPGFGVA